MKSLRNAWFIRLGRRGERHLDGQYNSCVNEGYIGLRCKFHGEILPKFLEGTNNQLAPEFEAHYIQNRLVSSVDPSPSPPSKDIRALNRLLYEIKIGDIILIQHPTAKHFKVGEVTTSDYIYKKDNPNNQMAHCREVKWLEGSHNFNYRPAITRLSKIGDTHLIANLNSMFSN